MLKVWGQTEPFYADQYCGIQPWIVFSLCVSVCLSPPSPPKFVKHFFPGKESLWNISWNQALLWIWHVDWVQPSKTESTLKQLYSPKYHQLPVTWPQTANKPLLSKGPQALRSPDEGIVTFSLSNWRHRRYSQVPSKGRNVVPGPYVETTGFKWPTYLCTVRCEECILCCMCSSKSPADCDTALVHHTCSALTSTLSVTTLL